MFYTREDENRVAKPFFVPENSGSYNQEAGEEIITDNSRGLKFRIDSDPSTLYPNEYLVMGELQHSVTILNLAPSGLDDRIDVYEGEFQFDSFDPNLYVEFPGSLKWDMRQIEGIQSISFYGINLRCQPTGYDDVYHYRIVNGLAQIQLFSAIPS